MPDGMVGMDLAGVGTMAGVGIHGTDQAGVGILAGVGTHGTALAGDGTTAGDGILGTALAGAGEAGTVPITAMDILTTEITVGLPTMATTVEEEIRFTEII